MTLRLRISPCPNDTFMFDALVNGRIDTGDLRFEVEYHDIEALNRAVLAVNGQAGEAGKTLDAGVAGMACKIGKNGDAGKSGDIIGNAGVAGMACKTGQTRKNENTGENEDKGNTVITGDTGNADQADISKISCAILPAIADRYVLLESGAALGRGNGPLLVRRAGDRSPIGRVAVPGLHTTANALMMRLFPQITERTPLLFSQIAAAVERGDFDAGVLIHEGRFVYLQRRLELVADLGLLWEQTTALPLPLGGIVARRSLPESVRRQVEILIRQSIEYALAHPEASRTYIKEHAQELDDSVIDAHIALFVNQYSLSLGNEGRRAVEALTGFAL